MDLTTTYLGLELSCPLVAGASPIADDLDRASRIEDAGAGAIVLRSLFEEQIEEERRATLHAWESHTNFNAEAASFLPSPSDFAMGPDAYLAQVEKLKKRLKIPVIGSLNGETAAGWLDYAKRIERAGADALELNVYHVATDPRESAADVEQRTLDVVIAVKESVRIPVAVKLSPFFSALAHFVAELDHAGADGFVLFNRFYQPDIDPETLEVVPRLHFSDPSELPLRLRWLAALSGRVKGSLAATGGVHSARDAIQALMAGAHAVQMVSALLQHGPGHLAVVRADLVRWMEEREYVSVRQMQGSMSLQRCPDPSAFERANYMRVLSSWQGR